MSQDIKNVMYTNPAFAPVAAIGDITDSLSTKKKVWNNTPYNETTQANYNQANEFADYLNNMSATDEDLTDYSGMGTKAVKKSSPLKGSKTKYYTTYGINNNTSNQNYNDFVNALLNGTATSASDYISGKNQAAINSYNDALNAARNDLTTAFGNAWSNGSDLVNSRDNAQYNEALRQLQTQLNRGFLSEAGYNEALGKLNSQRNTNQASLSDMYNTSYNNWLDDLAQTFAKEAYNDQMATDQYAWLRGDYYDPTKATNAWITIANYYDQYGKGLMEGFLNDANTYRPDEYIAYGSNAQGQYNPLLGIFDGKKKKTDENIGAF